MWTTRATYTKARWWARKHANANGATGRRPTLRAFAQSHARVRGTGGRQRRHMQIGAALRRQMRQNLPPEYRQRLAAVQSHRANGGKARQHPRHIVAPFVANGGVQTARALAFRQHIPQRNSPRPQRRDSAGIRRIRLRARQGGGNAPEAVLRMRVIFPPRQRRCAGHGAQNQQARATRQNWREA